MQKLKGDSHGFLVGDAVEIGDLIGTWDSMQADLRAIRKALENGVPVGASVGGKVGNKSASVQAQMPPQNKRESERIGAKAAAVAQAASRAAKPSGKRLESKKNDAQNLGVPPAFAALKNVQKPSKNNKLSGFDGGAGKQLSSAQKIEGLRDNRGRFTKGAGKRGGGADSDNSFDFGDSAGVNFGGAVEKLSKTLDGLGNAEQVDPAVKAFNEVAKPMTRGLEGLGLLAGGGDKDRVRNRWFRRFWGFFKKQQQDTEKHQKQVKKSLKVLEDKPEAKTKGGGGFFGSIGSAINGAIKGLVSGIGALFGGVLGGGVAGTLGKFFKGAGSSGLAKKIPIIGGLLMSLGGLFDLFQSETSDMSRQDKDRASGKAIGGIAGTFAGLWGGAKAGALGGGLLGSFAGPIGTAIGTALGGIAGTFAGAFYGEKAGAIIGEQVGTYARSAFAALSAGAQHLWEVAEQRFAQMADMAKSAFDGFTKMAASAFDLLRGWLGGAVDMFDSWGKAANGWFKEKTGIDVRESAAKAYGATKDKLTQWGTSAYESAKEFGASAIDKTTDYVRNTTMGQAAQKGMDAWNSSRASATSKERWAGARDDLVGASVAAGVDPGIVAQIAHLESGFNADARPIQNGKQLSSAHGYGQFINGTWAGVVNRHGAKYGVKDAGKLTTAQANELRNDKALQAAMLAEFTKENIEKGRRLGGDDDAANAYAFHNLGDGDAGRLLRALKANPNASVREALRANNSDAERARVEKVLANNRSIYGKNGELSVQDAYSNMGKKLSAADYYAQDAKQHAQAMQQAGAITATASAGAATSAQVAKASIPPAKVPTAGRVAVMPAIAPAPAPELPALIASADTQRTQSLIPLVDAGQDISERGIAHIATGGISS